MNRLNRHASRLTAVAIALTTALPVAQAADYSCDGLVPIGKKMVCAGFEPNWAVEFSCAGTAMTATFVDAFSGDSIARTPGTVAFSSRNPWTFTTSHGIAGSVAYTAAGCTDEADRVHDFTLTPTAAPGLTAPLYPFCCRIE